MKHTELKCTNPNCSGDCMVCNLFVCSSCGAYEGGLTSECPNKKIHIAVQEAICKEKIDFINGKWIKLIKNKNLNNYRTAKRNNKCLWCKFSIIDKKDIYCTRHLILVSKEDTCDLWRYSA